MKSVPNTLTVSRGSSELFSSPQNDEFFKFLKMGYFIISKNSLRDPLKSMQSFFPDPMYPNQNVRKISDTTETVRSQWDEELEFPWEDSPEYAVLHRTDTGKWYAVMMQLPKQKFGLAADSISEFILLRIPNGKRDATLADRRFLPAFHMNKRTWFAIQLDGGVETAEILRLTECSRDLAVKK